jgi:SSS family solute:Na+ symporter
LFLPMWAAPLLLPDLADPSQSYALLVSQLLPAGLIGLVLAGMFSHTMAMSSSDAAAISAVVTRDIIPALTGRGRKRDDRPATELFQGRVTVFGFLAISMVIARFSGSFGGVLGLIILWYGGLVGPIAIPMLWGLLKNTKKAGPVSAIGSWAAGVFVFFLTRYPLAGVIASTLPADQIQTVNVGAPVIVAIIVYYVFMWLFPHRNVEADELVDAIQSDGAMAASMLAVSGAEPDGLVGASTETVTVVGR